MTQTPITYQYEIEQLLGYILKKQTQQNSVRKIDSTNFILAREVMIEDLYFQRREMCGYAVSI